MKANLMAKASIFVKASPDGVWKALTTPDLIKQYMFGTNAVSDWKEGSSITYTGEWEGKQYEDHGTILKMEPGKLLRTTYWSSMSGTEDKPENYATVDYILAPQEGGTLLTVTQDNNKTEDSRDHSEGNWNMVLNTIKKMLEK